jgi:anti-sigma factor RsiW
VSRERPIEEADLHAYVDDALDPLRRQRVEAHLAQHPDQARRLAQFVAQRDALCEALAPVAAEPLPASLDPAQLLERSASARRSTELEPPRSRWPLLAAGALLFALGGAAGYALRGSGLPAQAGIEALAREAADSFRVHAVDPARPVEIDAAGKAELVRWFSERLQSSIAVPDLLAAGYRFLGGRLVTTPHGAAALFLYADMRGAKLAVLVRPMAVEKNTRMSEQVDGLLGSVAWATRGIGYSLVGAAQPDILHPLADEVRRQLDQAHDG